ncbi:MAG: hypothetical protein S4CHLAM6_06060 [Chlamydiae bacterium]|nr:hypothetical protein [Chlamydiota bacterium]
MSSKKMKWACASLLVLLMLGFHYVEALEERRIAPSDFATDNPYRLQDPPYMLPKELRKEKSGTLISTNTGIGFLFEGTKNRVSLPTYEAMLGYHLGNFFKVAAAYQYQRAEFDMNLKGEAYIAGGPLKYDYKVKTNVNIQLLAVKFISAPKHPLRWTIFTLYPYLAVGAGQGWVDVKNVVNLKRVVYLADIGIALGTRLISATAGCRCNSWSWENKFYSVIPYIGLQLSF